MSAAADLFGIFGLLTPEADQSRPEDTQADRAFLAIIDGGPILRHRSTGRINRTATLAAQPWRPCKVCGEAAPMRLSREGRAATTCGKRQCASIITNHERDPAALKAWRLSQGRKCAMCDQPVMRRGGDPLYGQHRFCSRACYGRARTARMAGHPETPEGYAAAMAPRLAARIAREQERERTRSRNVAYEAERARRQAKRGDKRTAGRTLGRPCSMCGSIMTLSLRSLRKVCAKPSCQLMLRRERRRKYKANRKHKQRVIAQAAATESRLGSSLVELWRRFGGRCQAPQPSGRKCNRICHIVLPPGLESSDEKATIGHIMAVDADGSNHATNLRLECFACNSRAGRNSRGNLELPL